MSLSDCFPISFPSEKEQLRRQAEAERNLTPAQRLRAVSDALAASERLSMSSPQRAAQLEYHRRCEEEWQRRMRDFIALNLKSL